MNKNRLSGEDVYNAFAHTNASYPRKWDGLNDRAQSVYTIAATLLSDRFIAPYVRRIAELEQQLTAERQEHLELHKEFAQLALQNTTLRGEA